MARIVRSVISHLSNLGPKVRVPVRFCSHNPHDLSEDDIYKKTSVSILNKEEDIGLFIDAYSTMGFRLNTGLRIVGPCAIFPRSILHWNVKGAEDINEKSLSLFTMLEPKLDILVIGIGEMGAKFDMSIIPFLRSKKINVEILPTDQACSTFNFLNAEKRFVAGALIPPNFIEYLTEMDQFESLSEIQENPWKLQNDFLDEPANQGEGELAFMRDKDRFKGSWSEELFPHRKKDKKKDEPDKIE